MTEPADRTPPNNTAAEQVVLGAMMLAAPTSDTIADITDLITSGDYYRPVHATIHQAIVELYSRGEPTGPVAVSTHLMATGDIGRVGGYPYLSECTDAAASSAGDPAWYARQVAETAGRRRLIEAGTLTLRAATDPTVPLADAIDRSGTALLEATRAHDSGELVDAFDDFAAYIDELDTSTDGMNGLPTGFSELDDLFNGLRGGQLIVLAGRPGMGKSTAAVDVARNVAHRAGKTAAIFSMEMSRKELRNRIMAAEARVPLHLLKAHKLREDDWSRVAKAIERLQPVKHQLKVDDTAGLTITDIRARARRIALRGPLDLIVVDYLQLMTSNSGRKNDTREREVADISRGLKLLAKELNIPVIAVAQLNRGPEMRADKRPHLADLRESGSLEQDADIVWFVHRDDYYDKETARSGEADFIIAKHRDGPTDTITVASQLHLSRFTDMALV